MSAYRLEVQPAGGKTEVFNLDATNQTDAEYEAEYVMHMFPLRLEQREGSLYRADDGRLIKQYAEEAVER